MSKNRPLILIDKDSCDLSYSCIKACPVQAISINTKHQSAILNHDRCIGCGKCITVCPSGAISFQKTISEAETLINNDRKTVAIVDPSVVAEFDDISDQRKLVTMIKELGFDYVNEISFGVDLISEEYSKIFSDFKGKYYITANCPAVVALVEKFYPEIIDNLAPMVSPMIATAKVVRKKYGSNINVICISPCIEAKNEIKQYKDTDGQVDSVITFIELRDLFKKHNIQESQLEFSNYDSPRGYTGCLYPISYGFLHDLNVSQDLLSGNIISTGGVSRMAHSVKEFSEITDDIQRHFNLFSCKGCLVGPGTSPSGKRNKRRATTTNYAKNLTKDFNTSNWEEEKATYRNLNLSRIFRNDSQRIPEPSEKQIQTILDGLGRTQDMPGCKSCGFDSCRDLAISIAQGVSSPNLCYPFSNKNRRKSIAETKDIKTNASIISKENIELKEKISNLKERNTSNQEMLNKILDKLPVGILVYKLDTVYHSNTKFLEILGDDVADIAEIIPALKGAGIRKILPENIVNTLVYTVENNHTVTDRDIVLDEKKYTISSFCLEKGQLGCAVIRDMSIPAHQAEMTVKRVEEVINKNLSLVQNIGFILGEGAADIELMLNSIVKLYDKKK